MSLTVSLIGYSMPLKEWPESQDEDDGEMARTNQRGMFARC